MSGEAQSQSNKVNFKQRVTTNESKALTSIFSCCHVRIMSQIKRAPVAAAALTCSKVTSLLIWGVPPPMVPPGFPSTRRSRRSGWRRSGLAPRKPGNPRNPRVRRFQWRTGSSQQHPGGQRWSRTTDIGPGELCNPWWIGGRLCFLSWANYSRLWHFCQSDTLKMSRSSTNWEEALLLPVFSVAW